MNIQIYGKSKCFDTQKAQRYFKERRISFQQIDLAKYGMSKGELNSIKKAVGGIEPLIDPNSKEYDASFIQYTPEELREEKLLEHPKLFRTPIVRNGNQATIGYKPEIWKTWE